MARKAKTTEALKAEAPQDQQALVPMADNPISLEGLTGEEDSFAVAATLRGDDGVFLGFEDFDQGDMVIPRRKIVQPTSREGNPGNFMDNLTGEEFEAMY